MNMLKQHTGTLPNSELIPSKMAKLQGLEKYLLGKCHFLPGGGAPENWGGSGIFS